MRPLLFILLPVGLLAALVLNSDQWRAPSAPAPKTADQLVARVGVLGASASAGVGAAHPLAAFLAASIPLDGEVLDLADPDLSQSPRTRGDNATRTLIEAEPTLVVAVDFLFWFAHAASLERSRRDDIDYALALLDRFSCPVVVGDLPALDTSELPAANRPGAAELAALNAHIRDWATQRPEVHLVPLSERLAREPDWLQADRLHPNEAGLAELAGQALDAAGLGDQGWSFDAARLTPASAGPASLSVEVVDERGATVRHGVLHFAFRQTDLLARTGFDRARLYQWRELAEPLSLADENPFRRDDLPMDLLPGGIEAYAEVPGHLPSDRVPVLMRRGETSSVRLVVPDAHPLEVRTFDSETGTPISGVLVVSLTELERRALDPGWEVPVLVGAGARTNARGLAVLRQLSHRPQRLEAHGSGYALRHAEPVEVDGALALPLRRLDASGTLEVRVAGPDGAALEGAAVGLVVANAEAARWERVGARGVAVFEGVPPGDALVHLPDWLALRRARGWHAPGEGLANVRAQLDRRSALIEPGEVAQVALGFLSPDAAGGSLDGSVHGLDGRPVPRAGVVLQSPDAAFGIAAVADGRGEFEITGLPPGGYQLLAGGTRQAVEITRGTTRVAVTSVKAGSEEP